MVKLVKNELQYVHIVRGFLLILTKKMTNLII